MIGVLAARNNLQVKNAKQPVCPLTVLNVVHFGNVMIKLSISHICVSYHAVFCIQSEINLHE